MSVVAHHVHETGRFWEVWILFCIGYVFGLLDHTPTLKLNERRVHRQQLKPLHVPHTPTQHLGKKEGEEEGRRRKMSMVRGQLLTSIRVFCSTGRMPLGTI